MVNHTALDKSNIDATSDNFTILHNYENHTHESSCPVHQFHQEHHLVNSILYIII